MCQAKWRLDSSGYPAAQHLPVALLKPKGDRLCFCVCANRAAATYHEKIISLAFIGASVLSNFSPAVYDYARVDGA